MTSLIDAESVLAVDIGSVNTRVLLFDVVDGQYHFISVGTAPSTAGLPFQDIGEGFHLAVQRLQEITGRTFIDRDSRLILPSQADGSGVDRIVVTTSAGEDLNLVTMGLLKDVSLESAEHLAASTYGRVVERVSLNDTGQADVRLDALVQARPDVIIVAGGTEKGATRSVFRLVELVSMACKGMSGDYRPMVIYCGNGGLAKRVKETLEKDAVVGIAPNIRPTIDMEDLTPAETLLSRAVGKLRMRQMPGFENLTSLSAVPLTPGANAFGRMIRYLGEGSDAAKGILGIDLGSNATTLAVAHGSELVLSVMRPLGMGGGLPAILQAGHMEDLMQWIPFAVSEATLRDYIYQKSLRPVTLPMTRETLAIEQAAARYILQLAMQRLQERWSGQSMAFEQIVISGAVLGLAPTPMQSLLMVLDGIQPVGIGIYLLDPYGVTQAMGAIAASNTLLPVQVIESGVYSNLGTVIAPISDARPGTVIMKVKIVNEQGNQTQAEIKQGSLVTLPIHNGQIASLTVETLHGTILDPARPRMKTFKVIGGTCGVVIDARGRPLDLPKEAEKRHELLVKWSHAVDVK